MDDPHQKKIDGWFYNANQPHEVSYFKQQVKQAHPGKSDAQVKEAIAKACDSIKPSEGRDKLKTKVNELLR
jgi:hypothetical protein